MGDLIVRELAAGEMPAAGALLGRSLRDNPSARAVGGADPARCEAVLGRLLEAMLAVASRRGTALAAYRESQLVGVCAFAPPGRGQPTFLENLSLFGIVQRNVPLGAQLAAKRWLEGWGRHETGAKPHWRLGPVGVEPGQQRQGIGRALLVEFCARVDAQDAVASLEADTEANRAFFQRFAFRMDGEARGDAGHGILMRRAAASDTVRWARPPAAKPFVLGKPIGKG
ncbi:MAG: GNAT family N-acetyltransferase [Opitutaceae bacterium]|nr:GNAT family N-acetyltransferase [Opitutaceae bacterium]